MKLVTLTTDLAPWRRGDHVPLPDELAEKVCKTGEAKNMRPYNGATEQAAPVAETYTSRDMRPQRRGKGYRTK